MTTNALEKDSTHLPLCFQDSVLPGLCQSTSIRFPNSIGSWKDISMGGHRDILETCLHTASDNGSFPLDIAGIKVHVTIDRSRIRIGLHISSSSSDNHSGIAVFES